MALQSSDLLVVQNQTDSKQYQLEISDLSAYLEGSSGIQFRGTADLNVAPSAQTTPITTFTNGDVYIVESDADPVDAGWVLKDGRTAVTENDKVIWIEAEQYWYWVRDRDSGGTLTGITATIPLKSTDDVRNPTVSINQARTTTAATSAADGEGTKGAVARLAEASDVVSPTGGGDSQAVVTADLLKLLMAISLKKVVH